jgi:hypothetical protein
MFVFGLLFGFWFLIALGQLLIKLQQSILDATLDASLVMKQRILSYLDAFLPKFKMLEIHAQPLPPLPSLRRVTHIGRFLEKLTQHQASQRILSIFLQPINTDSINITYLLLPLIFIQEGSGALPRLTIPLT